MLLSNKLILIQININEEIKIKYINNIKYREIRPGKKAKELSIKLAITSLMNFT